ncbi:hypothetical protein M1403_02245 [Patescibacteria group bacterium]|nr:hypothetical protein [Patescibacteria group bacterium]
MKSPKKNDLTLENIGKLIDQKLVPIDRKIVGIYGELDGIKQQITDVDIRLNTKIDSLHKEMTEGFDTLFDAVTATNTEIDKNILPRLKRLENKVFAC